MTQCHDICVQSLKVLLPDIVYKWASEEASAREVDLAALCSNILMERFLERSNLSTEPSATYPPFLTGKSNEHDLAFRVADFFVDYPPRSIELAQRFVDEALLIPNTKAFRAYSERGVGIEPNFVFIEYLRKREPGGIGVSFYGKPEQHLNPKRLRAGRNPNYSRATITTAENLALLLPEIKRSHDLRF